MDTKTRKELMPEGSLVIITFGFVSSKSANIDSSKELVVGTVHSWSPHGSVIVLLPDGFLFTGEGHNIVPYQQQN